MTSGIGYSATGSGEVRDKDGNLLSFEGIYTGDETEEKDQ